MSFVDNWRLMIKESLCDECRDDIDNLEEFKKRRADLSKLWHDPKYKTESRDELWEIQNKLNEEIYEKGKAMCFVFEADCGGDGFSLCKKHLLEIVERL